MKSFDPKRPHSEVDGDSMARFYQDGQYFAADHSPLSHEEAARPSVNGSFSNVVSEAVRRATAPSEDEMNQRVQVNDPSNRQNEAKTATDIPKTDPRREQLEGLTTRELNNAVVAAGGKKFTGGKARSKAIGWLLTNTD